MALVYGLILALATYIVYTVAAPLNDVVELKLRIPFAVLSVIVALKIAGFLVYLNVMARGISPQAHRQVLGMPLCITPLYAMPFALALVFLYVGTLEDLSGDMGWILDVMFAIGIMMLTATLLPLLGWYVVRLLKPRNP